MRRYFPRFSSASLVSTKAGNDNEPSDTPPTGPRAVTQLTDAELDNLERNFLARGVAVGPHYTLREVRHEKMRREAVGFDGAKVVHTILQLCAASPDLCTSYVGLHDALWPTECWSAYASLTKIKKALGAALLYCNDNDLAAVTTLVVRAADRRLSDAATVNIYNTCKRLGQDVGVSADDFVLRNAIAAMDLVQEAYPAA